MFADEPKGNLDSAATDRLISMRDGRLVDETRPSGGTGRSLGEITGLGAGS